MLRSNLLKVREKVKGYILKGVRDWAINELEMSEEEAQTQIDFKEAQRLIAINFLKEKLDKKEERAQELLRHFYNNNLYNAFEDWCQGLCSVINSNYYVNGSIELLGEWLEETKEEKERFSNCAAQDKITYMIYKELDLKNTLQRYNLLNIYNIRG